jgi:hypothetical protein
VSPASRVASPVPAGGIECGLSPDGRSIVIIGRFVSQGTIVLGAQLAIPGEQAAAFIARLVELSKQCRTVVLPGDVQ